MRLSLSLAGISTPFDSPLSFEFNRYRYTALNVLFTEDPSLTVQCLYQLGLFLFHSPLLKKSLLFSLPSLIDMLKLRESSYGLQINYEFVG